MPKCMCPVPELPPHLVQTGRNENSVSYRCTGRFIGHGTLTCDHKGIWTRPNCTCREPIHVKSDRPTCDLNTGNWKVPQEITCPSPPAFPNARIISRTANTDSYACDEQLQMIGNERKDKSIKLECSEGFELIGKSIATCDSTGRWSELPKCRYIAPPNPPHSSVVERADSFIEYKCTNGS